MKKLLLFAFLLLSTLTYSQVEKGDFNISGSVSYSKYEGMDGMGLIESKGGYYFTNNIEAGATIQIIMSAGETGTGIGPYAAYNFLTPDGKFLPYAGANFLLFSFAGVSMNSIGVNGGVKYFISESINIDGGISLQQGFGDFDGSLFTARVGIGFLLGKLK